MKLRNALPFLILFPALALAAPHEHGAAALDVVVEGNRLVLILDSPLDNLAGFEHAPRNDRQRAALKAMETRLGEPGRLFRPADEARCRATGTRFGHPFQSPDARADGHAELQATWEYRCDRPAALNQVEVLLFDAFPGVKRLRVQTVTPKGQGSAILTPARRRVSF